jgi:hypothetical protein
MDSCVLESELHAVERVPAEGRGKLAQFIPIRFLFTSNLSKDAVYGLNRSTVMNYQSQCRGQLCEGYPRISRGHSESLCAELIDIRLSIAYDRAGSGPPMLFVHGLTYDLARGTGPPTHSAARADRPKGSFNQRTLHRDLR